MVAPTSFMVLLTLLMGGGSDLLDYIPTQDYWQAKNVSPTVDALVKELQPPAAGGDISKLLDALASANRATRDAASAKIIAMGPGVVPQLQAATKSDDPEVAHAAKDLIGQIQRGQKANAVRRLMAIRTLGEMKAKDAWPALQELTKNDDPMVADYAKAAVAAIDGKAYVRTPANSSDDAWLLPEDTRIVLHVAAGGGKPVDIDAVMKMAGGMQVDVPGPNQPAPAQKPEAERVKEARKEFVGHLLEVAEKTGNIRVEGVTVGVSGQLGPNSRTVTAIVHGRYDSAAVADVIANIKEEGFKAEAKSVNGTNVFQPDEHVSFFFPSDERAVLTAAPGGGNLPIEELVANARANGGKLKGVAEMAKLIGAVDTKQALWGAVQMTDSYRQAPVLAPFDTITVVGQQKGSKLEFQFDGKGADAEKVADAVRQINQGVAEGKKELKDAGKFAPPPMQPMMKTMAEMLETVQCTADGKNAKLAGGIEASGPGSMLMMFLPMQAHAEVEPAPPPAPAPAPPR